MRKHPNAMGAFFGEWFSRGRWESLQIYQDRIDIQLNWTVLIWIYTVNTSQDSVSWPISHGLCASHIFPVAAWKSPEVWRAYEWLLGRKVLLKFWFFRLHPFNFRGVETLFFNTGYHNLLLGRINSELERFGEFYQNLMYGQGTQTHAPATQVESSWIQWIQAVAFDF